MELLLYVGNDLIEAVALDPSKLTLPGYLGAFKRELKEKHRELLAETGEQADFLVVQTRNPSSAGTS
jgi:hypothetical protein